MSESLRPARAAPPEPSAQEAGAPVGEEISPEFVQALAYVRDFKVLFEQARRQATRFRSLVELGQELATAPALEAVYHAALDRALSLSGHEGASILLLAGPDGPLQERAVAGSRPATPGTDAPDVELSSAWRVLRERQVLLLGNRGEVVELAERPGSLPLVSSICLPLLVEGESIGVLILRNHTRAVAVSENDRDILLLMSASITAAIHSAQLQEELQRSNEALAERERRLEDLVGRLFVAQEEERRRVAYDIHDGVAQVAAGAYQQLQIFAARRQASATGGQVELERALELARQTVREARQVIAGLRPTVLDDFGLGRALQQEIDALRSAGWQATYESNYGGERLPPLLETALFRVGQEALTNVRKHAEETRVHVALERGNGTVRLSVQDWGPGFQMPTDGNRAGGGERVGLESMRERVALLGGQCSIESQLGSGTRIVAELPIPGREQEEPGG